MKQSMDNRGFIKGFFILAVLAALAFVAIEFGKPYYRFNTLRSRTKDILAQETGTTETVAKNIMAEAAELNVPLQEENLSVTLNAAKITTVKATWSETVDFWGYYRKQLDFNLETEY